MFCPQCGQQASDEVRYCPRCGLSLVPHAAILAGQPAAAQPAVRSAEMTARRRGMRRGAKVMFFAAVLFPLFLVIGLAEDHPGPLLVPLMFFFAGLAVVAYARLFIEETAPVKNRWWRKDLNQAADRPALGAPQFVPASSFNQQRANTAEMVRPPSVTENTTTLLDKDV